MDWVLIVIAGGSFFASFVNAAFATGGIYILLATSTAVLPLTVAVPLQTVFTFGSLLARVGFFWAFICWPIVVAFALGSLIGVYCGTLVFTDLSEEAIAFALGALLLLLIWFPSVRWKIRFRHPFFLVGGVHSMISTMLGLGALLQPLILRTGLSKLQITGTLAGCLIMMETMKFIGYVATGFRYQDFIPHILLATLAGLVGTWAGKRVTHRVSERLFRLVFKLMITVVSLRLLYKGWVLGSG